MGLVRSQMRGTSPHDPVHVGESLFYDMVRMSGKPARVGDGTVAIHARGIARKKIFRRFQRVVIAHGRPVYGRPEKRPALVDTEYDVLFIGNQPHKGVSEVLRHFSWKWTIGR